MFSNFFVNVKYIAYIASHAEVLRGSPRSPGPERRDEPPRMSTWEAVRIRKC